MKKTLPAWLMLFVHACIADPPNNLVVNGHFDQDAIGWKQLTHTTAFWDTPDATFNPFSGSVWIVDDYLTGTANFRPALEQCVQLPHAGTYLIRVSGYVASKQIDATLTGNYSYRPGTSCNGNLSSYGYIYMPRSESWRTVEISTPNLSVPGIILLQLGTYRTVDGPEFTGHFDDIIVSDDAIFIDGFD